MTIDQLLADVTPLLPLTRIDEINRCQSGPLIYLPDEDKKRMTVYSMHAANHFPAMLNVLRLVDFHLSSAEFTTVDELMQETKIVSNKIKQALAAASEVGE